MCSIVSSFLRSYLFVILRSYLLGHSISEQVTGKLSRGSLRILPHQHRHLTLHACLLLDSFCRLDSTLSFRTSRNFPKALNIPLHQKRNFPRVGKVPPFFCGTLRGLGKFLHYDSGTIRSHEYIRFVCRGTFKSCSYMLFGNLRFRAFSFYDV